MCLAEALSERAELEAWLRNFADLQFCHSSFIYYKPLLHFRSLLDVSNLCTVLLTLGRISVNEITCSVRYALECMLLVVVEA